MGVASRLARPELQYVARSGWRTGNGLLSHAPVPTPTEALRQDAYDIPRNKIHPITTAGRRQRNTRASTSPKGSISISAALTAE